MPGALAICYEGFELHHREHPEMLLGLSLIQRVSCGQKKIGSMVLKCPSLARGLWLNLLPSLAAEEGQGRGSMNTTEYSPLTQDPNS